LSPPPKTFHTGLTRSVGRVGPRRIIMGSGVSAGHASVADPKRCVKNKTPPVTPLIPVKAILPVSPVPALRTMAAPAAAPSCVALREDYVAMAFTDDVVACCPYLDRAALRARLQERPTTKARPGVGALRKRDILGGRVFFA